MMGANCAPYSRRSDTRCWSARRFSRVPATLAGVFRWLRSAPSFACHGCTSGGFGCKPTAARRRLRLWQWARNQVMVPRSKANHGDAMARDQSFGFEAGDRPVVAPRESLEPMAEPAGRGGAGNSVRRDFDAQVLSLDISPILCFRGSATFGVRLRDRSRFYAARPALRHLWEVARLATAATMARHGLGVTVADQS